MFLLVLNKVVIKKNMPEPANNLKLTDEALMLLSAEGDKKAYYLLVKRWDRQIINYFYRNTGNQETAEDLAQEVFISIWKTKKYNPKAPFYVWIYKIARNKMIDHYRKKKAPVVSIENNPEVFSKSFEDKGALDRIIELDEQEMVRNTIKQLTEEQRNILILSKYQKLPYDDIGRIMNCSGDAVKVRVFRAVKSFVKKFKDLYENG